MAMARAKARVRSSDSALVAVHNSGQGWTFRVHRASDGVFVGKLVGTLQPNNIATFAPDAQLTSATGDVLRHILAVAATASFRAVAVIPLVLIAIFTGIAIADRMRRR